MKRARVLWIVGIVLFAAATVVWSAAERMSVQVKNGQLRATPSFLGQVVASVAYGDQVDVIGHQGDWTEVSSPGGRKGWIHQSALNSKRLTLGTGKGEDARLGASGEELALAGKGFNADVEARYRTQHRDADFASVDRMEAIRVTPPEMVSFLKDGNVRPHAGGPK